MSRQPVSPVAATNRKARHDYFIDETYECGIVLAGTEVKAIRKGQANLRDSYAVVTNGELFMHNVHISPYEQGNRFNQEAMRVRKLLMHKREIRRLIGYTQQKGLTLVPLSLYFKNGRVKVELAVCRGKKSYDKRETIAERDAMRDVAREMRNRRYDREG